MTTQTPPRQHSNRSSQLSPVAFTLLVLEATQGASFTADQFHGFVYLIHSTMSGSRQPRMKWKISKEGQLQSPSVDEAIELGRQQLLLPEVGEITLTPMGQKHCTLLGSSVAELRGNLAERVPPFVLKTSKQLKHLNSASLALFSLTHAKKVSPQAQKLAQSLKVLIQKWSKS